MSYTNTLYCSFCGKHQHKVKKLFGGQFALICDECVELCNIIIRGSAHRQMIAADIEVA